MKSDLDECSGPSCRGTCGWVGALGAGEVAPCRATKVGDVEERRSSAPKELFSTKSYGCCRAYSTF